MGRASRSRSSSPRQPRPRPTPSSSSRSRPNLLRRSSTLTPPSRPDADRARVGREVVPLEASAESQHAAVGGGDEQFTPDEPMSDNVAKRTGYRRGDVEAALQASDAVVDATFVTNWVHQGYIEPQVAMAELDPDGALHVTASTQGSFHTRSELAKLFDLPIARVRVTGATLGGGFGGKLLIPDPLAAGATLLLRRPGPGRADSKRGLPDEQPGARRRSSRSRPARRRTAGSPGSGPDSAWRRAASRRAASRASRPS